MLILIITGGTNIFESLSGTIYGPCIDIYAPGASIAQALPGDGTTNSYSNANSAAYVAGAVARYMSALDTAPTSIEVNSSI